uniref:Uncharacterized protein n=1 Tax=Polytomella parva TaxID=51329 RepID=A0A7S0UM08_9CHLO|eukprot:CAMPEP_0175061978 /NCGR_PEP_ID=MMETSP0052_2-20121109/13893_1 /TAXON_ID=51329 ORGANISM="Polytomella parva, Strain SAG 63-3" /NCGR_SAMPLE_ID=MMETSP0052_2 /ASSEMBLY_ACC=CAM_ASM_000194 /LENGTH=142 /DNA_ID=CAMNT_0016327909 /DNA_START=33 /DNA_END=461 /DNA_ORIENTATION=-
MYALAKLARSAAAPLARSAKAPSKFFQQKRNMGGHGDPGDWHMSFNGKPTPVEFTGPDYVTYAGLTLKREKISFLDHAISTGFGAAFTFTILFFFRRNWDEHMQGELYVFEKDCQENGYDGIFERHGHGHGHGDDHSHGHSH